MLVNFSCLSCSQNELASMAVFAGAVLAINLYIKSVPVFIMALGVLIVLYLM